MTSPADMKQQYRITAIIGLAMMGSLLCYAVIVEILRMQPQPFRGYTTLPDSEMIRYPLFGISVFMVVVITLVRRWTLGRSETMDSRSYVNLLKASAIVTFALCEVPAIFGLVLFMMSGSRTDFYVFLITSVMLFLIFFPRFQQWEEWSQGRSTLLD